LNDGSDILPDAFLIPASDPGRAYIADKAEIDTALSRVLGSGWYILGPECRAFESAFASYLNVPGVIGVSSGTDAIELAIRGLGIGDGDEVILPALTSSATATAVVRAGATPVFADIESGSFGLDATSAESVISPRTKALMPVHLYGHPCDLDRLGDLCHTRGLELIEDCAQAHGAEWGGRKVGTHGSAGAFSFYPTKNLAGLGDSGALVSGDSETIDRVCEIRQYGWHHRQVSSEVGMNSRMDELQAAVLTIRVEKVGARNKRRLEIANRYRHALTSSSLINPPTHPRATPVYHQYVIRAADRDALRSHLIESRIQAQVLYPVPLHLQKAFSNYPSARDLSNTVRATEELLCLPVHPELTDHEVDTVVDTILAFLG
jgi:dTDP-4-amino-4,6-dideoxygalactose transaminase